MSPDPSDDVGATLVGPMLDVTLDADLAGLLGPGGAPLAEGRASVLPQIIDDGGALRLARSGGPRYAPVRLLGRGGMGEVDLAEDRDIGRPVAIKRLVQHDLNAGAIARFAEEVRTIGRLEHPNVLPIHDVGVDADGRYFFVMKYLEGETLEAIITRLRAGDPATQARFDVARRVEIFLGVLRALDFAHAHGILHRDIKPANVMVGAHGEVVLMDWGVAGPVRRGGAAPAFDPEATVPTTAEDGRLWTTRIGDLVGTPQYMSPEQALGHNDTLDERSDLYAACVLFHELLGLVHRHAEHKTLMAVLMAVHRTEAPSAHTLVAAGPAPREGIPAPYAHLLHRGLQRDPALRWTSAGELIAEVEAIQRGETRVQCPVTLAHRLVTSVEHFLDRRHGLAAAVVFGVLLVSAASVIATVVRLLT
ncbi:MAG: serine/threonine protein kinase [Myxococcales bacterium]|nr:serine/threonine protein kinase [Myxococcales bacterium]